MPGRKPTDPTTGETRPLRPASEFSRDVRARAARELAAAEGRTAIAHVELLDAREDEAALGRVVAAVEAQLRPQDRTVVLGPGELLCVMPGLGLDEVGVRFAAVERALAGEEDAPAIRVGFAIVASEDAG